MTTTGWSVCYRGTRVVALLHMLPLDTHSPADWLYPVDDKGYSTAARALHTGRRPSGYCGSTCWTLNPGSGQSYCSFNSHTNSNSALVKYILSASVWTNSTKSYPKIKICFHGIFEQLAYTMNYFVCISVNEIYAETSCVSVLRCY